MKLSLNWLKEYIDPKISTDELIGRLTMAGLEVEGIEYIGKDIVLEFEITPNRPDCLSILGLAREIGAITGKKVKYPKIIGVSALFFSKPTIKNRALTPIIHIHIENKKECSRYIATLIRDVRIDNAPLAITQYLSPLGFHAINNVVDITNFVLMETGQPLHAFDYDKLAGGKIVVRRAKAGESIVTLDGIERKLDPSILVIADSQKPVAIAGIMGGRDTQITSETKNILLESAHFDLGLIRRATRALGLRTDSSYRFERNVNFEGVLNGANRATDLLLQLTGGHLSGRGEILTKPKNTVTKIKVKVADVESLLGIKVTANQVKIWLSRLGFKVIGSAGLVTVTAPSNRVDIGQDVDVIEEIARMVGFDHLPSKLPIINASNIPVNKRPTEIKNRIRQVLTAGGVDEIITHSMINSKMLGLSNLGHLSSLRIFNPLNQDQELMRPSMLPSLLQAAVVNMNRGQKDLRFFEIGKRYFLDGEKESVGIILSGRRSQDWRLSKKETIEIFDIKGILERIFRSIAINPLYEANQFKPLDPGCSASIMLNGKFLGSVGRIDHKVLDAWGIKNQDVYFAGLHLDEVYSLPKKSIRYESISEFPDIVRDVSLAVKKEIPYKEIEEICYKQGGEILRSVQFIEQYLGDKIQPGYKGLVFSCQYQSNIRTLREEEVSTVHERILKALTGELSAIRR